MLLLWTRRKRSKSWLKSTTISFSPLYKRSCRFYSFSLLLEKELISLQYSKFFQFPIIGVFIKIGIRPLVKGCRRVIHSREHFRFIVRRDYTKTQVRFLIAEGPHLIFVPRQTNHMGYILRHYIVSLIELSIEVVLAT